MQITELLVDGWRCGQNVSRERNFFFCFPTISTSHKIKDNVRLSFCVCLKAFGREWNERESVSMRIMVGSGGVSVCVHDRMTHGSLDGFTEFISNSF